MKFDVAWSDDTAENQQVKSVLSLLCVLYVSLQLMTRHSVSPFSRAQPKLPKSDS